MDYNHFIAGTIGGIGGVVTGHPFDTIRVKMQTQQRYNTYKNPLDCCIKILKSDGLRRGLYKGASTPLIGSTLFKTVNFGIYGNLLNKFGNGGSIKHSMIAGVLSSQACGIILVPIDRVKIILQTNKQFTRPTEVLRELPLKSLYRSGVVPTMARESMFGLTYFPLFQTTKKGLSLVLNEKSFALAALSGGITGSVSWSIVYPLDVIKSKIQSTIDRNPKYLPAIKEHYRNEGITGFYKGWRAAVYRAFPTHATVLAVYQLVINQLQ